MSKTSGDKPEVPPNIKEFNEITAVILAELYRAHPKPATIETSRIADILGHKPGDKLPSGHTFQDMEVHTLNWLDQEGGATTEARCALTAKTLGGFQTVGPKLAEAADQSSSETGKHKLAELMGDFFGAFTVSFTKSMAAS
jgi:hypothetical protein